MSYFMSLWSCDLEFHIARLIRCQTRISFSQNRCLYCEKSSSNPWILEIVLHKNVYKRFFTVTSWYLDQTLWSSHQINLFKALQRSYICIRIGQCRPNFRWFSEYFDFYNPINDEISILYYEKPSGSWRTVNFNCIIDVFG